MKPTVARYLSAAFDAYGVSAVFFVPTILSKTLYELERHTSIARILTHGEKAAAYMADGYARASGHPAVCMAQNIGAANLAAGLRDPYLGCSPVVALTGGPYESSRGRNYYQEIEDFPLFKPVTKFSGQVFDPERIPDMVAQAFHTSVSGKPRPTHLELPGHAGEMLEDVELDVELPEPESLVLPRIRMEPPADCLAAAARALNGAQRPVIVCGGGARSSGAGPEVVALAERLGIPVATSMNGKDTIPGDHPLNVGVAGLYSRPSANQVIVESDLVCYVGSQTGSQVTLMWSVPPLSRQIIQLDIEPEAFGRHYPNTIAVPGDAKLSLQRLASVLSGASPASRSAWVERCQQLVRDWREGQREHWASDDVPIRPERVLGDLSAHLPDDALVVSDTGHSGMWSAGYLDLNGPDKRFIRAAGSLGWGLPASLGAKLAVPERPVVLFTGDGGLWYHLSELETARRWNIKTVTVVNNNSSLNQEIRPYTEAYGGELHGRHHELWRFSDVDFARVAEAIGVRGFSVRKPADFASTLQQALETDGPTLIDVRTDADIMPPRGSAEPAAS